MQPSSATSRPPTARRTSRLFWQGASALCLLSAPLAAQSTPRLAQLERTVDSLRPVGNSPTYARALLALASEYDELARLDDAARTFRTAADVAAVVNDSTTLGGAHHNLGVVHWSANRYDSALTNLSLARRIRRTLPDTAALGRTLNTIGASHYQLGNYEPALEAFLRALEVRRRISDVRGTAVVLTNIGKVYQDWGQSARAIPVFQEAVTLAERASDPAVLGYALNSLARLHIEQDSIALARRYLARAVETYAALDSTRSRSDLASGWSLNTLAFALLDLREGRLDESVARLDSVRAVGVERGSVRGQAQALLHLGDAYERRGDRDRARDVLAQSLAFSRQVDQRVLALEALARLATLEEHSGRSSEALRYLRAHQALRDTIFDQSSAQRIASMEARAETEREIRLNAQLREEQRVQGLVIARQRTTVMLGGVILLLAALVLGMLAYFMNKGHAREAALAQSNADLAGANAELNTALSEVRTLKGLIPICSSCKSVRDDDGYWEALETYIASRSDAVFSHSICHACGPKLYGEHWPDERTPKEPHGPPARSS